MSLAAPPSDPLIGCVFLSSREVPPRFTLAAEAWNNSGSAGANTRAGGDTPEWHLIKGLLRAMAVLHFFE